MGRSFITDRKEVARRLPEIMLNRFSFQLPTQINYGNGTIQKVGELAKDLGAQKINLVTDKGVRNTDLAEKVIRSILEANLEVIVFDEVKPNPRETDCQQGGELAIRQGADTVVALGGGSSMDTAKAIAALMTNPGPIENVLKPNKLKNEAAPLICIPTTAGTGSEVTSFAVITLEKEKRKTCIFDEKVRPKVAINDPEVLLGVPAAIAAATGMDALTHAIEAYTCKLATDITDAFALAAIRLISKNIRDLVYHRNIKCCEAMMMGSLQAGIAFGFSDVAAVHCLAEAIGGIYDTPHGVANSIFLPIVFEFNAPAGMDRHADVAVAMGVEPVGKSKTEIVQCGIDELNRLSADLGIPKLRDLGYVNPEDFQQLSLICMKNVSAPSNPREVTAEVFQQLFERTYEIKGGKL